MRAFYQAYPIWTAVRSKLSWTHYRILLQIENPKAREWYLQESVEQNWSARALERQIDKLYYERLLASQIKEPVIEEAKGLLLLNANKELLLMIRIFISIWFFIISN